MVSQAQIKTCAMCGQSYDLRLMGQAYHHDGAPHAPLPPGAE
jgi:hypothetical protein